MGNGKLQVQLGNEVYDFRFRREHLFWNSVANEWQIPDVRLLNSYVPGILSIRTHCVISRIDFTKQGKDRFQKVVQSFVVRNLHDTPKPRWEGFRFALTRALKNTDFSRADRTKIWQEFHRAMNTGIIHEMTVVSVNIPLNSLADGK